MRATLTIAHRWGGLFIAVFLFIAGLTGAVISWDHELDEWLNAHLYDAKAEGVPLSPFDLARRVEAADGRIRVTYLPLAYEAGHNADLFVEPRIDPQTGELHAVDYNQVFIDPVSGEIAGKRDWGAVSLKSENLLPFLYELHYSMHIPDFWGIESWGLWFMGLVGIVWMFDCFVGFYLTLPSRAGPSEAADRTALRRTGWQRWKTAWTIKRGAGSYRRNLDLHRAAGLWLWVALFILAFTSISMNLGDDLVRPILSRISTLTPDAFDDQAPTAPNKPIEPTLSFEQAIAAAGTDAKRRGWDEPPSGIYYGLQYGLYAVSFSHPGDDHGAAGMGSKSLIVNGASGAIESARVPWQGTAADIFMQLQFPLHSGRIAGLPGRIFLSFMGLVVALLSATGIVIWFKKRAGRLHRQAMAEAPLLQPGE